MADSARSAAPHWRSSGTVSAASGGASRPRISMPGSFSPASAKVIVTSRRPGTA